MSFRHSILGGTGTRTWSIALATHLKTDLVNETTEPALALSGNRERAETRYRSRYRERKPPTAGYNCFGHVFALRRTALYDFDLAVLETILAEDGYGEVKDESIEVDDAVIYLDEKKEPFHAGRVIKLEPLLIGTNSSLVAVVLSKLDDVSGEYEHKIDEEIWPGMVASRRVFRARQQAPRPGHWRGVLAALP